MQSTPRYRVEREGNLALAVARALGTRAHGDQGIASATDGRAATGGDSRPRRRRLWDIQALYHCSLIGTCLTLGELREILAECRLRLRPGDTAHRIHGYFVRAAAEPAPVTRSVQKTLERKFRGAIRRFAAAATADELRTLWDAAVAAGDIPGPYWALMSHPAASTDLLEHVFGEVHMLSHLVGASNRAELGRVEALRRQTAELETQLASVRRQLAAQREENRTLSTRLSAHAETQERLRYTEQRLRRFEDGAETKALWRRAGTLSHRLKQATQRAEAAERRIELLEQERDEHRKDAQVLAKAARDQQAECESLEAELRARLCSIAGEDRAACRSALDLGGRTVLYVGGRGGLIAHFRALVEQANGRFMHHDGGLEENVGRLLDILGRGDVILCPVDCVSHLALQRAKRFCKQAAKPLVFLRSSGLSSFVTALRSLTGEPA